MGPCRRLASVLFCIGVVLLPGGQRAGVHAIRLVGVLMETFARILQLLDPVNGMVCVGCGVAGKAEGELLCQSCSPWCPDQDCRGPGSENGRAAKEIGEEMCQHCSRFCEGLDRECLGRVADCGHQDCRRAGGCLGHRRKIPRSAFFVYQLDNGYVGMTYDPSKRQSDHVSRLIDSHWKGVRCSDRNNPGDHEVRWLSPWLDSRREAFRCEWTLRSYRDSRRPRMQGIFQEITGVSSVPDIELHPPELRYDSALGEFRFWLRGQLSGRMRSSKLVAVLHYELECLGGSDRGVIAVEPVDLEGGGDGGEFSFSCPLSSIPESSWRVRAVNNAHIPGPWSAVVQPSLDLLVQDLVGVRDVCYSLRKGAVGGIDVSWDAAAGDLPGLAFEVERQGSRLGLLDEVIDLELISGLTDCCFTDRVEPDGVAEYRYRVRASLSGISGSWVDAVSGDTLMVGGPEPGPVKSLRAECGSLGEVKLSWKCPEWRGHRQKVDYEVARWDNGWVLVHSMPRRFREGPFIFVTEGLGPSDHRFRVRGSNRFGPGPWSEASVSREQMEDTARGDLRVRGLLCLMHDLDGSLLELSWNDSSLDPHSVFEIERWESDGWVLVELVAASSALIGIDLGTDGFCFYRVRMAFGKFQGDWSDILGVRVVEGSADLSEFSLDTPFPENLAVRLFALDTQLPGPSGVVALGYYPGDVGGSVREFAKDLKRAGIDVLGRILEWTEKPKGWTVDFCGEHGPLPDARAMRITHGAVDRVGQDVRLAIHSMKRQIDFDERSSVKRVATARYREGDMVEGMVCSVGNPFVNVLLGDVDGLVPVSEFSRAGGMASVGDVVRARVTRVNVGEYFVLLSLE